MKRKSASCILLLSLFVVLSKYNLAQKVINYGIEGWAVNTKGGRGGEIIRVTNLNSSGPGSLADAIAGNGARIIVFEVGGIIDLEGDTLTISNPYVTIAGQTAPSPGITLINGSLSINSNDVIIQHIRARPGASGHEVGWEPDGISTRSAYNVIIDHCSISWAVDENCSASGPRFSGTTPDTWRLLTSHDVTISNNIISEGLSHATHIKGEHSKGTLIHDNATNIAILRNLYAHNKERNPLFKGGARGVAVNNFIYNPGGSAIRYNLVASEWTGYTWDTGRVTVVGNVMQYGPNTGDIPLLYVNNGPCEVYIDDNIAKDTAGNDVDVYRGDSEKLMDTKPIWNSNIQISPADEVKDNIITYAGARPWDRDEIDTRIINEMLAGNGSIIDLETEVGGYPTHSPTNDDFNQEEWNMDYILPISDNIFISNLNNHDSVHKETNFHVEADANSYEVDINYLELLVNGVSEGRISTPPYHWELSRSSTGDLKLLIIAEDANIYWVASDTVQIHIIDTIATDVKNQKIQVTNVLAASSFPNPFVDLVTINFYLPHPKHVVIVVYNSMGQEVETLVTGYKPQGHHTISWNPKGWSSGVYYYRISTSEEVICGKLTYCK